MKEILEEKIERLESLLKATEEDRSDGDLGNKNLELFLIKEIAKTKTELIYLEKKEL